MLLLLSMTANVLFMLLLLFQERRVRRYVAWAQGMQRMIRFMASPQ